MSNDGCLTLKANKRNAFVSPSAAWINYEWENDFTVKLGTKCLYNLDHDDFFDFVLSILIDDLKKTFMILKALKLKLKVYFIHRV